LGNIARRHATSRSSGDWAGDVELAAAKPSSNGATFVFERTGTNTQL
jgi:hypothetical protein